MSSIVRSSERERERTWPLALAVEQAGGPGKLVGHSHQVAAEDFVVNVLLLRMHHKLRGISGGGNGDLVNFDILGLSETNDEP